MARSAFESPWPPPIATTRGAPGALGSGTVEVAMADARVEAEIVHDAGELIRDHDAAVVTTGAADADGEVRLALVHVRRKQEREEPPELVEEGLRLGLVHHVLLYPGVGARQRAELVDPVRVRKEPAVEQQVDV